MILPLVPLQYTPGSETERNRRLLQADQENFKHRRDVELVDERLIIRSADGTRWQVVASNAGVLSLAILPAYILEAQMMPMAQGTLTVAIT